LGLPDDVLTIVISALSGQLAKQVIDLAVAWVRERARHTHRATTVSVYGLEREVIRKVRIEYDGSSSLDALPPNRLVPSRQGCPVPPRQRRRVPSGLGAAPDRLVFLQPRRSAKYPLAADFCPKFCPSELT
jgi:hypothetical protein